MPTPPSRMELYPRYDDAMFQGRVGLKQPSVDRFGGEPIEAQAPVTQAAVIYSDNPAPLEKLVPDKPGNSPKKADGRQTDSKRTKVVIERNAELAYAGPETVPQEQSSSGGWLAS